MSLYFQSFWWCLFSSGINMSLGGMLKFRREQAGQWMERTATFIICLQWYWWTGTWRRPGLTQHLRDSDSLFCKDYRVRVTGHLVPRAQFCNRVGWMVRIWGQVCMWVWVFIPVFSEPKKFWIVTSFAGLWTLELHWMESRGEEFKCLGPVFLSSPLSKQNVLRH